MIFEQMFNLSETYCTGNTVTKLTCPPKQISVTRLSLSDNETLSVVCRYRKLQLKFLNHKTDTI